MVGGGKQFSMDQRALARRALGALLLLLLFLLSPAQAAMATDDPIAAYSFDEASGEDVHDVAGGHDGTVEGASWAEGKYGSALRFDAGEESIVSIPAAEDLELENFTIEAWLRPADARLLAPAVAKLDSESFGYALYAGGDGAAGHPEGYLLEGKQIDSFVVDSNPLPLHCWTHVAVSSDGSQMRLYINGELVDSGPTSAVKAGAGGPLQIGGNQAFGEGEYFSGKIDEVRIYDRALSEEEIEDDKDAAVQTPPSQDPVAAYSFDAASGEVAEDIVGNHDGQIEGAEWAQGKYGSALTFDAGAEQCVVVPHSPNLELTERFTIETWVKPEGDGNLEAMIYKEAVEDFGYTTFLGFEENGEIGGFTGQEGAEHSEVTSPELPTGYWSHLALTFDGDYLRLYVDGELADVSYADPPQPSDGPLSIGCAPALASFFNGKLDEIRVYNRALDSEEIGEDMGTAIQSPPSDDPVAAYTLDTGTGEVAEDLTGAHDGEIEGAEWTEGKYGKALSFNAEEEQCATVPHSPSLELTDEFTIETWAKPEGDGNDEPLIFKNAPSFYGYALYLGLDKAHKIEGHIGEVEFESTEVRSSEKVPTNVWTHFAFTFDGEHVRLYVNGELVDTTSTEGPQPTKGPLQFGCGNSYEDFFNGKLDEIRIYDRQLDCEEIIADMESDHAPPKFSFGGTLMEGIKVGTTSYDLDVHAIDGEVGFPGVGATQITISVDGVLVDEAEQECPEGNCELTREWNYDETEFTGSSHEIVIQAMDRAGETSEYTIEPAAPDGSVPNCRADGEDEAAPDETTSLGSGGSMSIYHGSEVDFEVPAPPPGFKPLEASNEELRQYGFPVRPSDSATLQEWEEVMADYKDTVASDLCTTAGHTSGPAELAGENTVNWSGFQAADRKGKDRWSEMQSTFIQPFRHPPRCPDSSSSHWIGFGGSNSASLIQLGTVIDRNGHLQAFLNFLAPGRPHGDVVVPQFKVKAKNKIHLNLAYSAALEQAKFSYFNRTTGDHYSLFVTLPKSFYDGSTAGFIDERRFGTTDFRNLPNFGVNQWSSTKVFTIAGKWQKLGEVNRHRLFMHPKGGQLMAAPGNLKPDGKSFTNNWIHCHP